jgi:class 3 adenylate cyclase/tetratricopeptide (TPR) repeat protein
MDSHPTAADSTDHGEQIDALLEQATQAIDRGDTARAVELAESAFALDPDNEDARAIVAFARFRSRRRSPEAAVAPTDDAPATPAPQAVPSGAAEASVRPVESVGERRRLTVLFCDVVGSTELASRLDPEDTREVLRQYQAACASVIESYGGTVAHFIGDGILAYFGFPVAHEDDAVRAALAGREMVTAVEALHLRTGGEAGSEWLAIRVGIHTGLTVVADMGGGRKVETYDIVGETPNLAARIQGEAPPGEVLISEATFDLARAFIEVEDHGSPPLKGVARPVQLYRVVGERRTPWRFEAVRDTSGLLVGRQHELSVIDTAWARARDEGAVVFLRGDAGIGKSRLVDHAADMARQDGATVLIMQCASLRSNESLWPAAEAISALGAAGELDGHTPVDELLRDLSPSDDDQSGASPAKQREQRFAALIDWLDSLGESRRLLVVVEDLHWSDATTLELVHRLVDRAPLGRFLLLLTSRSPLHVAADHVQALHVEPLSMDDCAMMIEQLVDDPDERIAVRNSVIARSDGVPLFINELTKLVIGSGSESLELSDEDSVPIALHDLLVARVDQFADQREVAQALATFGQPTGAALLTSVLDQPDSTVVADLDALEAGGLIRRVGDRYEFVHVLLREAALRLQLRRHRRTLHGRIAVALEAAPAANRSFDDAIIAHHYSAAGDDMRAAEFWLRAGKSALRRNAQVEATELLNAALAAVQNLPESPERTVAELDVVMALGPALINSKGYGAPDVEAVCLRAQELCEVVGDVPQRVPALINLWAFLGARAQHREAVELADTIMELAQEAQSDDLLIEASVCVGVSNTFLANFDVALESFERIGALYDATTHESHRFEYGTDPAALALSYRALINWFLGNEERSRAWSEETETFARSLGHPFTEVFALGQTMFLRIFAGDLDDAERLLQECRELSAREAIPAVLPEIYAVLLMAERGDPAVPETCQAITDFARFAGLLVLMPYVEAVHANALSARGDHAEAEAMMAASLESMNATDERWAEAEIHRLRGNLLERRGAPPAEVEECYRLAVTIARRMGVGGFESRANDSLERWLARA